MFSCLVFLDYDIIICYNVITQYNYKEKLNGETNKVPQSCAKPQHNSAVMNK